MKLKTIISSILFLGASIYAQAQEFPGLTEGKDYIKVQIKDSVVDASQKKPVLIEFFWYGCPHCNKMRPLSSKLFDKYKNKIITLKYPVGFPNWESGARMFFTFEEMKNLDKMHDITFEEVHTKRNDILADVKKRNDFLTANGVDVKKFNETYSSFSVNSKWVKSQRMVLSHQIEGSPDYIVYSGGYAYKVEPALVNGYDKTIENIDKIIATKLK